MPENSTFDFAKYEREGAPIKVVNAYFELEAAKNYRKLLIESDVPKDYKEAHLKSNQELIDELREELRGTKYEDKEVE